MIIPDLAGIKKTTKLINRKTERDTIKKAIFAGGNELRVVIVSGEGGVGKTRLLEEVSWLLGNPNIFPEREKPSAAERWLPPQPAVISDILDFTDTRLHTFNYFLEQLNRAFDWSDEVKFLEYQSAIRLYKRKIKDQADFFTIKQAAEDAEKIFFKNYNDIAEKTRLVWVLDTTEQLTFGGTPWIQDLLQSSDLMFSTQQRLLDILKKNELRNTTIILVGRPETKSTTGVKKGNIFFDAVRETTTERSIPLFTVELKPFSAEDVQSYFEALRDDNPHIDKYLEINENTSQIFYAYTTGRPICLAMALDAMIEGKQIPEPLLETSLEKVKQRIEKDGQDNVLFSIEQTFLDIIFAARDSLKAEILVTLARARKGLTAEQLDFIFTKKPNETVAEWAARAEDNDRKETRREIDALLDEHNPDSLWALTLVKKIPSNRIVLQDEFYSIFDKHMSAEKANIETEKEARKQLYEQLVAYDKDYIAQKQQRLRILRDEDLASLHQESPARALRMKFRPLSEYEEDERIALEEEIFEYQLERLHYLFRINPSKAVNDTFHDMVESWWLANNIEADVQLQIEFWRLLADTGIRDFITMQQWESTVPDSTPWQVLERYAIQDEIVRWIKRLFLRREWNRAIDFANAVNRQIKDMQDEALQYTLLHTFSRGERIIWQEFARIVLANNIDDSIAKLRQAINDMERLLLPDGIPEKNEFSYLNHPIEPRLKRVIGIAYNHLGIGYVSQGKYAEASQAYSSALRYLRDTELRSRQAVTRNNLSRVLAELGLIPRAVRVCQDALQIRQDLGTIAPVAYSLNTLALIYNRARQPEYVWYHAALAIIYFRRLEDPRGLGMSLLQLAEGLRHLAFSNTPQIDTPEELLDAAIQAISEAEDLFPSDSSEIIRHIEIEIEAGCIYRDYMYYLKQAGRYHNRIEIYRDRAIALLEEAAELAHKRNFHHLEVDARDDLAWTYYFAGKPKKAEKEINKILGDHTLIPPRYVITKTHLPVSESETQVLFQLGKLYALLGKLKMDYFITRREEITIGIPNKEDRRKKVASDEAAQQYLKEAAEAFVLALAYRRLYSVCAPGTAITFNSLYDYLRKFNVSEMKDFYKYQDEARKNYHIDNITPKDMTDIAGFLEQSFGDFWERTSNKR